MKLPDWNSKNSIGVKFCICSFLVILMLGKINAQSAHSFLRSGDLEYDNDQYQLAEEEYRKSLLEKNGIKGTYNLGNAIYQQKRFDEAVKHYMNAAEMAKDNTTKANAYHNLGNALYAQQDFQESVNAYKNALRLNPKDVETKFNLGQAQRQLRIQQQQQQQQQQQSSDSEEGENEPDDQQQQQDSGEQQDQNPQQQQQPVGNDQEEQEQQPQPKDLSKEEAQQLLKIMDEEERKVQEKVKKAQSKPSKSSKDW